MHDAPTIERIRSKYVSLAPVMDERTRRQWAAAEAVALGWGGVSTVALATGMARNTVASGVRELKHRRRHPEQEVGLRQRAPGGGRKPADDVDPELMQALEQLVDPATRGDPESPLRWTCKSTQKLADELSRQNHPVTARTVAAMLKRAGYSLQANRKSREGSGHPDRNAQFESRAAVQIFNRNEMIGMAMTKHCTFSPTITKLRNTNVRLPSCIRPTPLSPEDARSIETWAARGN